MIRTPPLGFRFLLVLLILILVTLSVTNGMVASSRDELKDAVSPVLARAKLYLDGGQLTRDQSGMLIGDSLVMIANTFFDTPSMAVEIDCVRYEPVSMLHYERRRAFALIAVDCPFPETVSFDTLFEWARGDTVFVISRDRWSTDIVAARIDSSGISEAGAYEGTRFIVTSLDSVDLPRTPRFAFNPAVNTYGEIVGISVSSYRDDGTLMFLPANQLLRYSLHDRDLVALRPVKQLDGPNPGGFVFAYLFYVGMALLAQYPIAFLVGVIFLMTPIVLIMRLRARQRYGAKAIFQELARFFRIPMARVVFVVLLLWAWLTVDIQSEGVISSTYSEWFCEPVPPPTDEQWTAALESFREGSERRLGRTLLPDDSLEVDYDFVRTAGQWFFCVMSKRNDSIGVYQGLVGRMEDDYFYYASFEVGDYHLRGESMQEYVRLAESDSLWSLFGAHGFWEDEDDLKYVHDSIVDADRWSTAFPVGP